MVPAASFQMVLNHPMPVRPLRFHKTFRTRRRICPLRPARRRWKGVQRDKSLWRRLRKTARRAGGSSG